MEHDGSTGKIPVKRRGACATLGNRFAALVIHGRARIFFVFPVGKGSMMEHPSNGAASPCTRSRAFSSLC